MQFLLSFLLSALLLATTALSQPVGKKNCDRTQLRFIPNARRGGVFQSLPSRKMAPSFAKAASPVCKRIGQCYGQMWKLQCDQEVMHLAEAKRLSGVEKAGRFNDFLGLTYTWRQARVPFAKEGLIRDEDDV